MWKIDRWNKILEVQYKLIYETKCYILIGDLTKSMGHVGKYLYAPNILCFKKTNNII